MTEPTRKLLLDYGVAIAVAIVVALFIRFSILEAYRIPNYAMRPALEAGDTIFVSKSAYGWHWPWGVPHSISPDHFPKRGDVVVYASPRDVQRDYIKRVIGLPGDQISIRKGRVQLNGKVVTEALDKNALCTQETLPEDGSHEVCWEPPYPEDFGPQTVPADSVFVLGDLRTDSKTHWGVIPTAAIKGKALWIWLSIGPRDGRGADWFPQIRFERMMRRIR